MEPLAGLAAGTIAKLAFDEFVKSSAGEVARQSMGGAIDLVKNLQGKIKAKFAGNNRAEAALAEIEQQGSEAALQKVSKYLDLEMDEDETFATEIRQMAEQIINIQNQNTQDNRTYHQTAGRDLFNIDKIEGDSHQFGGGS